MTEALGPATILLVDDEKTIVKALRSELLIQSHTIHVANSGPEALDVLQEHAVEILITDLHMPGMNGLELISEAAKIQPDIQSIVLTGFGDMQNAVEALNRGASGYMLKPPDLQELEIQIAACQKKNILKQDLRKKNEQLEAEIAKRSAAEQELRQAKAYADTILASMADSLLVISMNGEIQNINQSGCKLLAYSEVDLIGTNIERIFSSDSVEDAGGSLVGRLQNIVSDDGVDNVELVFLTKNGQEIPVLVSASTMFDEQQTATGIVVVAKDITEYKLAQKALREKEAQLIHAGRLTAMGEMASGIAHELNQPLTIIRMTAQNFGYRLASGLSEKANPQEVGEKIMLQVDRAANIINLMRSFARSEDNKGEIAVINPEIPALDALTFFREQFRVHEIELVTEIQENLPKIAIHPNHYEQIIVNLISNARYAVNKRAEFEDGLQKKIIVRLTTPANPPDTVLLEIEDNGIGMTEEEQKRCWEPFFSTKEVGEGTGLGLYIIHSIIKERRGSVEIHSTEGNGCCFLVTFPAVNDS